LSRKSHSRMSHRLSQFGAYFFHPSTRINAVHNSAKETQALGNIVAVDANVFFARPAIERQKTLHAGRLREQIGGVPELRRLHDDSAGIEDALLSEEIESPRPLHQAGRSLAFKQSVPRGRQVSNFAAKPSRAIYGDPQSSAFRRNW